jgi:hypothetical protein
MRLFWRRRDTETVTALLALHVRMEVLEQAVLTLCDHVEALEQSLVIIVDQLEAQRKPRVAKVIPPWPADGRTMVQ